MPTPPRRHDPLSLDALIAALIARAPNPRPRARTRHARLTGASVRDVLARAAAYPWAPAYAAHHGGAVANAYGYPAATTGVAVAAIADDDTVWIAAGSGALRANKVTLAGVVGRCVASPYGRWWSRARLGAAPAPDAVTDLRPWVAEMRDPVAVSRPRLLAALQDALGAEAATG